MARILVTGMSGTGKSSVLAELGRRGYRVVDTDDAGWREYRAYVEPPRRAAPRGVVVGRGQDHEAAGFRRCSVALRRGVFREPIQVLRPVQRGCPAQRPC